MKFSIVLLTYNRHALLRATLKSLSLQTYKNFEIILLDNGSEPPVDPSTFPPELDINLVRYEKNEHGGDLLNKALSLVRGTHVVPFLADDDVWTPSTLEIVAETFNNNPDMRSLGVGYSRYDLADNRPLHDESYFNAFSSHLQRVKAFDAAIKYCSIWGIGPQINAQVPRMGHSSGAFFDFELIKRTIEKQKELFVKPFGDVGFLGCCFHQQYLYYLDLPLVVLGESHRKMMDGSLPGQRMVWKSKVPYLKYSPLKGCSFANMGVESHLKVFYRNGIDKLWDGALRIDFFLGHILSVLCDDPWTDETDHDLEEAIPFIVKTVMEQRRLSKEKARLAVDVWIRQQMDKVEMHKKAKKTPAAPLETQKQTGSFADIIDFVKWQERKFVRPYKEPQSGRFVENFG